MPPTSSPRARPRRSDGRRPAGSRERTGGGAPPPTPAPAPLHERDLVAVCGLAAVEALFAADPRRVERLFFEPRFAHPLLAARRLLGRAHKPYRAVEADELARIAGTVRHGGVVAVARPKPLPPLAAGEPAVWVRRRHPLLILDGVGNPHNLGAIARSAAYFGVEHVILAERPDQALPSAASYRIAEGGLDRLALHRAPLPAGLAALRPFYRIVGTAATGGVMPAALRRDRPIALILGDEESGLAAATLAACDAIVTIPAAPANAAGQVQSLNVAAAAAVLLYVLAGGS